MIGTLETSAVKQVAMFKHAHLKFFNYLNIATVKELVGNH